MDPNLQKLQVAETLVNGLLALIPAYNHAKAQALLSAASGQLLAIDGASPPPPLVAPAFVPADPAAAPVVKNL